MLFLTTILYLDHSSDPSFHSWTVPIIKIIINKIDKIVHVLILKLLKISGIGIRIVISTSKIKKITATKKKCKEKGTRADDFGSYPHSKGEPFSRCISFFMANLLLIKIRATDNKILNIIISNIMFSL